MPPLDKDELKAFHEDFLKLFGRVDQLEKDFKVYQEQERVGREAMIQSQRENTRALLKINLTMENHIEKTSDMVESFENVRGAVRVLDWMGRVSGIAIKIIIAFAAVTGIGWAWINKLDP